MNNHLRVLLLTVALIAVPAALAGAEPSFLGADTSSGLASSFITAGKSVYLMMPPVLVSGPSILNIDWAPDAPNAVLVRQKMKLTAKQLQALVKPGQPQEAYRSVFRNDQSEVELLIYSHDKVYTVWKGDLATSALVDYDWLAGGMLYASVDTMAAEPPEQTILIIRTAGSKITTSRLPVDEEHNTYQSPDKLTFAVTSNDTLYLFRADGKDSVVPLPADARGLLWAADGSSPYVVQRQSGKNQFNAVDGNRLVPLEGKPALFQYKEEEPGREPFKLAKQDVQVSRGKASSKLVNLWLEVPGAVAGAPGLVAGDSIKGRLAPGGNAVLYITAEGSAYVRGIVPIDLTPEDLAEARAQAVRAKTMSDAKQAAMGVLTFASDNDDRLPDANEFAQAMRDYVKMDIPGFQYTYSGGKPEEPSDTIIGYLQGPGGRAIVYADGHAKWEPEK